MNGFDVYQTNPQSHVNFRTAYISVTATSTQFGLMSSDIYTLQWLYIDHSKYGIPNSKLLAIRILK